MKKILIALSVTILLLMSSMAASAVDHYDIQIHKNGEGAVSFLYDHDKDTVSLGCEEESEKFICWDIHGDYEIIENKNEGKICIIEPHSDLDITAVFGNALCTYDEATPDMTSPKTGDNRLYPLILTFLLGISTAIIVLNHKSTQE